jgi:SAM-dependent methyltransferase
MFALTLFVSAGLLFLVQPLVGRLLLPFLGGTPAVWNTCMVFFQAALLAGYAYAHFLSRRLPLRRQIAVHAAVLVVPLLPLLLVRFDVGALAQFWPAPAGDSTPRLLAWLLVALLLLVGLPFFAVSATAPLLQKWFSGTDHAAARDPYFLYGASNVGSLLALAAYPSLVEPGLTLRAQGLAWTAGFVVLALLILACGRLAARSGLPVLDPKPDDAPDEPAPSWPRRLRWLLLAVVPSVALLGCTTHLTTDVSPMPLLWVVPLGLYLLSFILVFARVPLILSAPIALALPLLLYGARGAADFDAARTDPQTLAQADYDDDVKEHSYARVMLNSPEARPPLSRLFLYGGYALFVALALRSPEALRRGCLVLLPAVVLALAFERDVVDYFELETFERLSLHLAALFVVCVVCHGELARTRPGPAHLTGYYLLMSLGGVLGGLFATLAAPLLFDRIWEYPLVVAVPCLLLPRFAFGGRRLALAAEAAALAVLLVVGLCGGAFLAARTFISRAEAAAWVEAHGLDESTWTGWLARGLASRMADDGGTIRGVRTVEDELTGEPVVERFAIGSARTVHRERNFFGSFVVERREYHFDEPHRLAEPACREVYHALLHGTTMHGTQKRQAGLGEMAWDRSGHTLPPPELMRQRDEEARLTPLSYFHRDGPVGQLFAAVEQRDWPLPHGLLLLSLGGGTPWPLLADPRLLTPGAELPTRRPLHVGVIGVGAGTLAAYGQPGWRMTLYDIDPGVVRVAQDPDYFTYLSDARARGVDVEVRIGDGRLGVAAAPDGAFDLLLIDAFNSDAIPVHLLTREAFAVYRRKLKAGGVLFIHITNRHLRLDGVVGDLARDAGLTALLQRSSDFIDKASCTWVAFAEGPAALGDLATRRDRPADPKGDRGMWVPPPVSGRPVWTDDRCDLLGVYKWDR